MDELIDTRTVIVQYKEGGRREYLDPFYVARQKVVPTILGIADPYYQFYLGKSRPVPAYLKPTEFRL